MRFRFVPTSGLVLAAILFTTLACASDDGSTTGPSVDGVPLDLVKDIRCKITEAMMPGDPGLEFPGDGGAPRWGMPDGPHREGTVVRRSWSSLSDAEKQEFVDGILLLKQTYAETDALGSRRADYVSYCDYKDEPYRRNLYDYYVELHMSAYVWMMQPMTEGVHRMAHMGPQFLPWHRYLLLRLETDLREVLGQPDFTFPYWNWEDCQTHPEGCPDIFDPRFLGTGGTCGGEDADGNSNPADEDVRGYLVDQGFQTQLTSVTDANDTGGPYDASNIVCGANPLRRSVGCSEDFPRPASEDAVVAGFERPQYDAPPYDNCATNQDVSFRQYLEGFNLEEQPFNPLCISGGCKMHGLGHFYVGGDMTSLGPSNDPIFFLHHANVDRLWAEWQDKNRAVTETTVDYGNPGYPDDWKGPLFNFPEIAADETFDFRALGYRYDTNPEE